MPEIAYSNRAEIVDVALPTNAPPFPGYAGLERCTLIAPLPHRELGLAHPVFQCRMERYLGVGADGQTLPIEVPVGGAAVPPLMLHAATYGAPRSPRAWLGRTLLRGSGDGLHRWVPSEPPAAIDPAQAHVWEPVAGPEADVLKIVGGSDVAWALTTDSLWRITGAADELRATRFFALADVPLGEIRGRVTGEFCRIAALDETRVILRFRNYGMNALFIVDASGARALAIPVGAPVASPGPSASPPAPPGVLTPTPGAPAAPVISPPPTPPRGGPAAPAGPAGHLAPSGPAGMTPPRVHEPIRFGGRVFVGTADDRLLVFAPATDELVDVTPVEGLRQYDTRDLRRESGDAATGPAGPTLLALGGRLRVCGVGRCVTLDTPPERTYTMVVHMEEARFLVLYVGPRGEGGASVVTLRAR